MSLERTSKAGTTFLTGTATGGSARTLILPSTTTVDRYRNYRCLIISGTGTGQSRRIIGNTTTTLYTARAWDINPDATSVFEIWGDYDRMYMIGNGASTIHCYDPKIDMFMQGQHFDDGITNNIACKVQGWQPFGITSATRIAAGVTGINPTPTAAGTGYSLGDQLTCSVGGTGCVVVVTGVASNGAITSLELMNAGTATGFTTGTGKALTGGTGSAATLEVTSVGVVSKIVLATNHFIKTGMLVTLSGFTESLYNAQYTVLCVNGLTTFDIATTATANGAATSSLSTTTIVDPTKSWTTNEHIGKLVHIMVAGLSPTSQIRWITANTATTLTFAAITAAINGTSKYIIYDSKPFGVAEISRALDRKGYGWATSGSTTTLVDTSKNWVPGIYVGSKFRIDCGTGLGSGLISITANSSNTLTFSTQTFTPDTTTRYEIQETWGICTSGSTTTVVDSGKLWPTNLYAGKRIRITGGSGTGQEYAETSNTTTTLTVATMGTAADATSTYAILDMVPRGAGVEAAWLFGNSDSSKKGKYIVIPRGAGSIGLDIYDVTTEKFLELNIPYTTNASLLTTGTMYAYDGGDRFYIHFGSSIIIYNVTTNKVEDQYQISGIHGTALIGNRMEILDDSNNVSWLYIAQHTGTLMWRSPIIT